MIPIEVERAASALGLDVAAAATVRAFESRGIATVLLKGPAVAHWLYAGEEGLRSYTDADLLVSPASFEAAEEVLAEKGFTCLTAYLSEREKSWLRETPWQRPGSPPVTVDLHRGFHGVDEWGAWWTVMDEHTSTCQIAGQVVRIPDRAGCALTVTLNDAEVWRSARSREDLRRALLVFDGEVWAEAARRASLTDSLASFCFGLSQYAAGRDLIRLLDIPERLPLEIAARAASAAARPARLDRAGLLVHRLGRGNGWDRARALWGLIFPSSDAMRATRPLARRGHIGLAVAIMLRPLELLVRAPGVLWHLWRGYRHARRTRRSDR